jgi:hypothetical protein
MAGPRRHVPVDTLDSRRIIKSQILLIHLVQYQDSDSVQAIYEISSAEIHWIILLYTNLPTICSLVQASISKNYYPIL